MQQIEGARGARPTTREFWLAASVYVLFISSLWTVVGMELAVLSLHALVLYHRARTPIRDWLPRWVWLPFFVVVVLAVISSLAADEVSASLARLIRHYRIFVPLLLLPALAQVSLRRLVAIHAAIACVMTGYGMLQYLWALDLYRHVMINPYYASGTFDMYHTYAGIMLMAVPVYLSIAISAHGRERLLWVGASLAAVLAVVVSLSRAGWLGLAVALIVLGLRLPRRFAVSVIALAAICVTVVASLALTNSLHDVLGRVSASTVAGRLLSFETAEHDPRLILWQAALRGIRDAPLLGHGLDVVPFFKYLDALRAERGLTIATLPNWNPHNTYLEIAFYLGIPGLLAFLAIWGVVLAWCGIWIRRAGTRWPFETSVLWGLVAALCGSLVNGMFGSHWVDAEVQVSILMWMGVALYTGLVVRQRLAQG